MRTIVNAPSIDVVDIPDHPDGGIWTHVLSLPGEQIVFADSATDAVGAVAGEEYDALGDDDADNDEALGMRYDLACAFAAVVQHVFNQQAVQGGYFDPANESEFVLTALHQSKNDPWVDETAPGGFGGGPEWTHRVPLVLVSTHYAPYTDIERPAGNILWIDPAKETDFLSSLYDAGLLDYRVYTGETD